MGIEEAIKILGFERLEQINRKSLTVNYRQLMKSNHPDAGGDVQIAIKINNAQEILSQVLGQIEHLNKIKELSNKPMIFTIIPLDKLVGIYKGESISVGSGDDTFKISRKNLRSNKVVLNISCDIQLDGVSYRFNNISQLNIKDEYSIRCIIKDVGINKDRKVNIKAYGKDVNLNIRGVESSMNLNFEDIVKLKVIVERRVV